MGLGPAGYLGYMPDNTIDLVTTKQLHPVEFPMDMGTDPGHGHSKETLAALVAGARGRVPTATLLPQGRLNATSQPPGFSMTTGNMVVAIDRSLPSISARNSTVTSGTQLTVIRIALYYSSMRWGACVF